MSNSTSSTPQQNSLELLAIPELCEKNFFIPDYQRGYRWGKRQVEQLLNDISSYFANGKGDFYCLQPIVVRRMDDELVEEFKLHSETDKNIWYEVIDGQQRLTTIHIIMALSKVLLHQTHDKSIYYQTRPKLSEIYKSFKVDFKDFSISADTSVNKFDDIDSWHILQAANTIMKWMKNYQTTTDALQNFINFNVQFMHDKNSAKSVQVIWYELKDGSSPVETFKRINDKKISLNNAELIRAMFLSDSAEFEYDQNLLNSYDEEVRPVVISKERAARQSHIIEQWDIIEKQLRQSDFWNFIKDDGKSESYSCRIEYLFDLIAKKKEDEKDEIATYLRFEELVEKKEEGVAGLWSLWLKVESYFNTLQSWYQNREFYHKIGFLIAELGSKTLIDLLDESSKQTKSYFKKDINWRIKKHICLDVNKPDDIYTYSYDDPVQYKALKRILFFFNVESTRISTTQHYFPFELYKDKEWTLEHIHAQNSERIDRTDKEKWKEWIEENLKVLRRLQSRIDSSSPYDPAALISDINNNHLNKLINKNKSYGFKNFSTCFDSVTAYYNRMAIKDGGSSEIHSISNMALLSNVVNSSISNSVFEVKRQLILEKDAAGEYIPYCTRLVFLKYYNKGDTDFSVKQSFYWSKKDRENYLAAIKKVLNEIISSVEP